MPAPHHSLFTGRMPSCHPSNSVKALKEMFFKATEMKKNNCSGCQHSQNCRETAHVLETPVDILRYDNKCFTSSSALHYMQPLLQKKVCDNDNHSIILISSPPQKRYELTTTNRDEEMSEQCLRINQTPEHKDIK